MPISEQIRAALSSSSLIRKMFEEGLALKRQYGAAGVFDFSLGNPDLDPPAAFHEALLQLVREDAAGSHGYMPNAGYEDVRRAIARKASAEHEVTLDAAHIVMSVGAAGALNVVFKTILNPQSEVIVPRPYFMEYRAYIANHGGTLVEAPATADFNLDIDAIRAALTPRTAAVLINSPHNPTGRVYSRQTLAALAALLTEHGSREGNYPYLIADEPYREIVYDGKTAAPVLCCYRNAIVVTSYSKNLSLPGERIGYIALGPELQDAPEFAAALAYATRTLGFVNAPALMQRCVALLTGVPADTGTYARRRAAFMEILDEAGIEYAQPEGAFYIFARVPAGPDGRTADDGAFVEQLKKERILGVPGSGFGAAGWARFAYCVHENHIRASKDAFLRAAAAWKTRPLATAQENNSGQLGF